MTATIQVTPKSHGHSTGGNRFWLLDDPALDENGQIVQGGMWAHQREWWDLPNFVRGLITGYGGGKTFSLGKRMIALALHNAPVPVITVSPTYPMALTTIVETIDELLTGKQTLDPTLSYKLFRSQPYRFSIRHGRRRGTILCYSGENPDRLKGSNVAAAGIDEPFMQQRAVLEQVAARVRHPRAKRREINLTGTPEGVIGWGFELFEGDLRSKYDVGFVQCSSHANLALPADYLHRLESAFDDEARAAYVEGKFVNMAKGRVYYAFDPTVNVEAIEKQPDGAEWGAGMDFNVNPMSFVVFWRKGDRLHITAEHELPNSDSEQAADMIREQYPQVRSVYPDATGARRQTSSAGKSDHDHLRSRGLRVVAHSTNPPIRDRYNAMNGGFKHGRVTVSPDCRKLRQYLQGYTHDEANKASQKAMSHLLDAMGYPVAFLLPVKKPQLHRAFSGA